MDENPPARKRGRPPSEFPSKPVRIPGELVPAIEQIIREYVKAKTKKEGYKP